MADNASITILRNTKANIDAEPIKDGNILFTTDQAENKIYTDVGTERIKIGGTVDVDTELSTTSTNPVQNKVITNSINDVSRRLNEVVANLFDTFYPIGFLFSTTDANFNPNTATGWHGKWERITDCVIYAAGTSDTIGSIVGSNTHTLTTAELPSHTHSIPALSGSTNSAGAHTHNLYDSTSKTRYGHATTLSAGQNAWSIVANPGASNTIIAQSAGAHTHTVKTNTSTTGSQGSGTAIDMRPRRLNSVVWRRTA